MADIGKIKLTNVRLSFPHLFRAQAFTAGQEASFNAAFILDKSGDAEQILEVRRVMTAVAREKWGANVPKGLKLCLRDGAEPGKEEVDGYGPTVMFMSASSRKRIPVVDRNLTPLTEEDGKPYAGCYVNASLRVWAQDNEFGKRINAQLQAVQFALDGDPFGEAPVKVDEEFEKLDDGEPSSTGGDASPGEEGGGLLG